MTPSGATFRPATPSDVDRLAALMTGDAACVLTEEKYRSNLEKGEYRLEWTWLAENAQGEPIAVAVWWGPPAEPAPGALDGFYTIPDADVELAAELLKQAHAHFPEPPAYHVFVPGDWRDQPDVVQALTWRQEAAARAGLTELLERLRYEWTAESPIPRPDDTLTFHPEPDDEVFLDLFIRTLSGSLDQTSTAEAAEIGPETQARQDLDFLKHQMAGDRDWWRIAKDASDRIVGFGIPSRNTAFAVVGYLGVLPEFRGRGHVDRVLAEITRFLAEDQGAEIIRADTDLDNRPMAAAFERAGYHNFARRLVHGAS